MACDVGPGGALGKATGFSVLSWHSAEVFPSRLGCGFIWS